MCVMYRRFGEQPDPEPGTTCGSFAAAPASAAFVAERLHGVALVPRRPRRPTADHGPTRSPRCAPSDGFYLFMEPTSAKGRDLRERGSFGARPASP